MKHRIYALLALLACTPVLASENAHEWLDRMVRAVKTLNYEGTFVFIHGKQMEAMRIYHSNDSAGERERMVSLAGSAREVLRDDDRLTCILPDSRSVVVEKSRAKDYLPSGLQRINHELKNHYVFRVAGEDRMAGLPAKVIEVEPKDPFRYGYRLWLDQETAMLLKSDLLDENGTPVEQVMFTELRIHSVMPSDVLIPSIDTEDYQWFREEDKPMPATLKTNGWTVEKLPAGFRMGMHKMHALPTSHMPVEHLVFTDGISSVSVFIEKIDKEKNLLTGLSSMGAVNAYGLERDGYHVTVVGEVPKAAVKMIGDYVRYKPGSPND